MEHRYNMPIIEALMAHTARGSTAFHMPGHKMGKGLPHWFKENLTHFDLTEISGMDNLHNPTGVIKEAQELASRAFGSKKTWFLVNGASCGIHAAIMTVVRRGEYLLVSRDCHISVIHAIMLAGARPVYMIPEYLEHFGITTSITPEVVESALVQNPEVVGVILTRPTYYGICADIKSISEVIRRHEKILIVDEAHGAHLGFSTELPESSIRLGADISIQSAHKTLTALTQSAYIHVNSDGVDVERLAFYLSMFQTTSPSYILLASLDLARAIMENEGEGKIQNLITCLDSVEKQLKEYTEYKILGKQQVPKFEVDKTRLVINVGESGRTGFSVATLLEEQFGIYVEMADLRNIVLITTLSDELNDFIKLTTALSRISTQFINNSHKIADIEIRRLSIPTQVLELSQVLYEESRWEDLTHATSKISAGTITPYPPGIPLVCPGEEISHDAILLIKNVLEAGGKVNGISEDLKVKIIKFL